MKKFLLIFACLIIGFGADAAQQAPRGRAQSGAANDQSTTASRSARTPRTTPAKTTNVSTPVTTKSTGTRSVQTITQSAGRSAVTARAAKQSVVSNSTKVAAAAQNTVVDENCWNGFMGCMDSFCMLDNTNGGRCVCSDKNAEYDAILAEIQSLDEQSYQMATFGVEQIEMGDAAKVVTDKTNSITKRIEKDAAQSKRKSLDLSAWNINEIDFDADVEDIFSLSSDGVSMSNKTGDALYRAAAKLCKAQLPECDSQSTMMELMYKQRVRSDCTAYENSLRQQRVQSAQKLAAAKSAMREAALEQYRNANKYDLGQCTVEFKKCMQTTGGCGDDFSGCVGLIQEVTSGTNFDDVKQKKIKGTSSSITIARSTYDILEAKKELCMTVTQQCVNVGNQVWDTFLREVAPQVKSAELIAESDMRTSCISNIAACFQKACKDNMDPNDPDGSYDMCLTRPETLSDVCKIEIRPCENSITNIMDYVRARLASMRVDSCTREFKQCLTSEDRCGEDYTQCVGLDTDTIVKMCPADKLVGCQYEYNGDTKTVKTADQIYQELANIAQGIFLSIDNNTLTACQRALDTSMLRVCGSTENCDELTADGLTGARSLKYEICSGTGAAKKCYASTDGIPSKLLEDTTTVWNINITGTIPWGSLSYDSTNGYTGTGLDETNQFEIDALSNAVKNAIETIKADTTVDYCVNGRNGNWRYTKNKPEQGTGGKEDGSSAPRFPKLANQMEKLIPASVLRSAYDNYLNKYDELSKQKMKDAVKLASRIDENAAKKAAREECEKWHDTEEINIITTTDVDTSESGYTVDLSNTNYSNVTDALNQRETHASFNEITGECIITTRYQKCELSYGFDCLKYGEWTAETSTIKLLE